MQKVRIGLRLPIELNTKLILKAAELGVSKNSLVIWILQEWIKTREIEE